MRRTEGIVWALLAFCEPRQAVLHPERADPVPSPCQDFVRIALVTNIPDQLVARGVEDCVDRHSQFHNPKTRAQMPAGDRNRADGFGAQFMGKLGQLAVRKGFQIGRDMHPIEQRCIGTVRHDVSSQTVNARAR